MATAPIPPDLAGRAFTVRTGSVAGLSKARMGRGDLARPTYGVRMDTDPTTVTERARATAVALPQDVAFSHATAAWILGLPMPSKHEFGPLDVMRPSRHTRIRRRGCRGRIGLEHRTLTSAQGLTLTSEEDTWLDLADLLELDDLVVLGDAVAERRRSTQSLHDAVARRSRLTAPAAAQAALRLIRVGSRSPMETRARLVFVRAGLPEPELNAPVWDEHGEWIAMSDFVWRAKKVVGEFQGETHFGDFQQGDSDIGRRLLVQDHGWRYVEMTKLDIDGTARRGQLVDRLRRYLAA